MFSLQTAKSECFGLLFKRKRCQKVSSAYARCQRCQVRMRGVRNGVKGIRESVMTCWVVSGRCQCFELVSGRFQCCSVPYCCWCHLPNLFMYSAGLLVMRWSVVSVPGEEKIFSLSPEWGEKIFSPWICICLLFICPGSAISWSDCHRSTTHMMS